MRGSLLATFAIALAIATPVAAQEADWPEGSAMSVGGLELKRRDAAADVLFKLQDRLLNLVSRAGDSPPNERLIKVLEAQQASWARYVVDECELVGALSGAGGSWPSTYAVRCEADLYELRVRRTRGAIGCLEKPTTHQSEPGQCLYPLTSLAAPQEP